MTRRDQSTSAETSAGRPGGEREFLVEFEVRIPQGALQSEIAERESAEASAAAKLAEEGHLVRLWRRRVAAGPSTVVGLYRGESERQLEALLRALPMYDWMNVTVTALEGHPNDPGAEATAAAASQDRS
jgi:muconolactone D-isomerase